MVQHDNARDKFEIEHELIVDLRWALERYGFQSKTIGINITGKARKPPMLFQESTSPCPCIVIHNPSTSLITVAMVFLIYVLPTSNLHASKHRRHCMNRTRQVKMGNLVQNRVFQLHRQWNGWGLTMYSNDKINL